MPKVAVGCAGWPIPGAYRDRFADGDSVLARYASRFPVVEINSSFYRPHQRATYARWAAAVPQAFRFSVKIPKAISHERGLRQCGPELDAFLEQTAGLSSRLGGYLLQLPPSLVLDLRSASLFLRMVRRRTDARLALEPRHPSWFSAAADELLARHAVGRVHADPAIGGGDHEEPAPSPAWRYWRWHGSPRMYYSAYPEAKLQALARVLRALPAGTPAWVIFDNTAHGHATANALRLQQLME